MLLSGPFMTRNGLRPHSEVALIEQLLNITGLPYMCALAVQTCFRMVGCVPLPFKGQETKGQCALCSSLFSQIHPLLDESYYQLMAVLGEGVCFLQGNSLFRLPLFQWMALHKVHTWTSAVVSNGHKEKREVRKSLSFWVLLILFLNIMCPLKCLPLQNILSLLCFSKMSAHKTASRRTSQQSRQRSQKFTLYSVPGLQQF